MIKVSMGEQEVVDATRIKAEGLRILLLEFTATLVHSAVDENPFAATLDPVTRASDAPVRTVE